MRPRPRCPSPLLLLLLLAPLGWAPAPARAQAIREEVKKAKEPKLTKPPTLVTFVPAEYPPELRQQGLDGQVELLIDLDKAGKVTRVEVLSSPHPEFSRAAEAAVRKFVFSPAEVDGKPAPIRLRYAYNFVLDVVLEPELPQWMQDRDYAGAGDAPLVGVVREAGTRLPVAGAAVVIRDEGLEVKADSRGRFQFRELTPGTYRVEALSLEHKPAAVDAEVRQGEQTRLKLYVESTVDNPYETVVRGKRPQTVVTRVTLKQKELTTVPGTFGDPVRVLENLPGMARLPYVGGALIIRGSAPGDSGIYLDGTEIPLIYHFLGGPSVLNPEFLDRIDYYPGNPDVRYGRLLAGVVDVHTRNTFSEKWGGSLDINLLNAAAMVKIPISERVSVSAAARRSYIDALLPSLFDAAGQTATAVVPVYYDYQLRTDIKLSGDDTLFFLIFGSDDQLTVASNEPDADIGVSLTSHTSFHRLLAGWRWQITDKLSSHMTPTIGFNYVDLGLGSLGVSFSTFNFLLREELRYKARPWFVLRAGLDMELEQLTADTVVPLPADYRIPGSGQDNQFSGETQPYSLDATLFGLGLYADAVVQLTDALQVVPGVRFDLYHFFGNTRAAAVPRATVRYTVFDRKAPYLSKLLLKGAAGMFNQEPGLRESDQRFGNPNLSLRQAAHFSGGFELRILPALSLDLQGYYLLRYDEVVPTNARNPETGEEIDFANEAWGYSYGMELLLKHDVTRRFYGWISYTLSQSKEQEEPGGPLINYVFDQTHILTLVGSLRLGWGVELGARFRLVTGRPETPIVSGILDVDRGFYRAISGQKYTDRLPTFHQLDLRLEKTWIFDWWRLSVYLDVQNVYNADNAEAILWDYRYRESGPLQGIPVLPTFGIKGSF